MSRCPICQREVPDAAIRRYPYLWPEAITLATRINPAWTPGEGLCSACFDALMEATHDARTQPQRLAAQNEGFREYFRYHLTARELVFWNHQNDDIRRWKQGEIMDAVSELAESAGYDAWAVFDAGELLVGQGVRGSD